MSDEHEPVPGDQPDLTPEQDAEVRRLLGALPPVGPIPEGVVARLDDRLAALVAERRDSATTAPSSGSGDEVAARRADRERRRRWRTGLVAAASIVVVGVGIGTIADDLSPDGWVASQSDSAGGEAGAAREQSPEAAKGGDAADAFVPPSALLATSPQHVSSGSLEDDVARIAARGTAARAEAEDGTAGEYDEDGPTTLSGPDVAQALAPCSVPSLLPGDEVAPVRLDGERATLVVRAGGSGAREAEIYACDSSDAVLARTSVPAR